MRSLAALLVLATLAAAPAPAGARTRFRACPSKARIFRCTTVEVPLDRGGHVPGTVGLRVQLLRAPLRPRRGTLLILAGGPGEASTSGDGELDEVIGDAAGGHWDVIEVDQRGTGFSGALRCRALRRDDPGGTGSYFEREVRAGADCARELGPKRNFYTTLDSVADLEAVRTALGLQRWGLLGGVSYGTYVTQAYARLHPGRVERLLLDSVVSPAALDAYTPSTFAAVPRILQQVCAPARCREITADPVGDAASLVSRLDTAPLQGWSFRPSGKRQRNSIGGPGDPTVLFNILVEGDFQPALRAGFPAAVRSALAGDAAPMLRLAMAVAQSGPPANPREFSNALFAATSCAESRFPWARNDAEAQRRAAIAAGAAAIPESGLRPFNRATAAGSDLLALCLRWPGSPFSASPAAPLPNVPALVLDGRDDLRTPLEDAQDVAAQLPRSALIAVPNQGHSVLFSQPCAQKALGRFLAGRAAAPACQRIGRAVAVQPVAPRRLGDLAPAAGFHGRVGRTVAAVGSTLADSEFGLELGTDTGAEIRFGGLRGGRASFGFGLLSTPVRYDRFSYVPGVTLTGKLNLGRRVRGRLRVGGRAAARGTLRFGRRGVEGRLGGRRVSARLAATSALVEAARAAQDQPAPIDQGPRLPR